MTARRNVTVRLRVPVHTTARRVHARSRTYAGRRRNGSKQKALKGGFLPLLIPLIAAAIGAVPGIAAVALQASRKDH